VPWDLLTVLRVFAMLVQINAEIIMKRSIRLLALTTIAVAGSTVLPAFAEGDSAYPETCPELYHHSMKQLHSSKMLNLCDVTAGKPVLLVNTASHCGFTDQFEDLEAISQKYKERGLVVLGVSSDSFNQEAEDEAEVADVCYKNFGVTFTMLSTVPVKGDDAHPLFKEVASQSQFPRWNFHKYLINPAGEVVDTTSSFRIPSDGDIEELLTNAGL
jgi:glutathione peroxidase